MAHAVEGAALAHLGKIEPGAEMRAFATEHHRTCLGGQVDEGGVDLRHQGIADGIAFGRAHQPHMDQRARALNAQQVKLREQAGGRAEGRRGADKHARVWDVHLVINLK